MKREIIRVEPLSTHLERWKAPTSIIVHHLDDSRSQRILTLLEELGHPYQITQHKRDSQTRRTSARLHQ